jgi:hypothetical protein
MQHSRVPSVSRLRPSTFLSLGLRQPARLSRLTETNSCSPPRSDHQPRQDIKCVGGPPTSLFLPSSSSSVPEGYWEHQSGHGLQGPIQGKAEGSPHGEKWQRGRRGCPAGALVRRLFLLDYSTNHLLSSSSLVKMGRRPAKCYRPSSPFSPGLRQVALLTKVPLCLPQDTARTSRSLSRGSTGPFPTPRYVLELVRWLCWRDFAPDLRPFAAALRSEFTILDERRLRSTTSPSAATWSPTSTSRSLRRLSRPRESAPTNTLSRPPERSRST